MTTRPRVVAVAVLMGWIVVAPTFAQDTPDQSRGDTPPVLTPLDEAHQLFYSGRYEASAARALEIRTLDPGSLAASELRASALHFQIRRALGEPKDRDKAWKACTVCQDLMPVFLEEFAIGQAEARARLVKDPVDDEAQFFLGKIDLNYVWLQLATIGRKTGWKEYWEARRSLDAVLKRRPDHIRARVARAWIDYIVDTKLPFGTAWLVGGGNKKRGLSVVREVAAMDAERFVRVEATFALWDMQVREKNFAEAVMTARALSAEFPDNVDLIKFVATHGARTQ
ncbi:MAG: hypothetical protein HOP16_03335 [Acidobacteria bacterium]|nr:hypothetical protein [Acidobacteriota bacterium]